MLYLLALSSAVVYGAADFMGGLASRRASAIAVVAISQLAGLVALLVVVPFLPGTPAVRDVGWGMAAGLAGGTGVALLYKGLAVGPMGIVAPTTAVSAVAIPVIAGVLLGERPERMAALGIALAMVAIVLVSQQARPSGEASRAHHSGRRLPTGLVLALLSGVASGVFFLALARTSSDAGMWPLVAARTMSVPVFAVLAAVRGRSLRLPAPVRKISIGAGVLDMLANVLYLVATWHGALTIAVTLASLYPASTVVLARFVLAERLSRIQQAGIVCALVAVVLIVGG